MKRLKTIRKSKGAPIRKQVLRKDLGVGKGSIPASRDGLGVAWTSKQECREFRELVSMTT